MWCSVLTAPKYLVPLLSSLRETLLPHSQALRDDAKHREVVTGNSPVHPRISPRKIYLEFLHKEQFKTTR
jgi:hypothetical protein